MDATPCDVMWRSPETKHSLDVALLLARSDLVPEDLGCDLPAVAWGEFRSLEPRGGCHASGFPTVGRDADNRPRPEQIWGTLTPGIDPNSGQYILTSGALPPARNSTESSPWAGLSGAAVFFRKFLVGVIVEDDRPERWRHSRVAVSSVSKLLEDTSFREAVSAATGRNVTVSGISDQEIADQIFEDRYAESVHAEHGKIRIFGLDLSRSTGRGLNLDTAYLNLEAISNDEETGVYSQQTRVDALLEGKRRVLLRGQAGSGKSTLIQWIATQSVSSGLKGDLSNLNGNIPFVLRLRAMFRKENLRPKPSDFLQIGNIPISDDQPAGWADRVLRDGRALLLIDGMDEIPEENRDEARDWLGWILEHYPQVWALVTVRPSAVPRDWLADYGFRELALSPMDRADRRIFIEQWHRAATIEACSVVASSMELERIKRELNDFEKGLLRNLEVSPQLAALTNSPLLCAMICALHRDRNGALPSGRMEIYRAALAMLLARRDQERQVDLRLEEDEHRSILQEIAAWLVNEGLAEGSKGDAILQISRILPSLHRVSSTFSPESAYDHVVDRSGLITETSVETFEFIHRTFQDYLAAQEFKEARSFSMLARHASDEQWDDVIRMTVGHCDHRDRAELLQKIVAAGDAFTDEEVRHQIHLLAGSCLPYASRLSEQVRDMVLERVSALLPTSHTTTHEAGELATVGDDLISLFSTSEVKPWMLQVLGRIRSDLAFDFLRGAAGTLDSGCLQFLGSIWDSFDVERYSAEILSRVDCAEVPFWIDSPAQVFELAKRGPLGQVTLDCIRGNQVLSAAGSSHLNIARLKVTNAQYLDNVNFIRSITGIDSLSFLGCRPIWDMSAVTEQDLRSLTIVDVRRNTLSIDIEELVASQDNLVHLGLGYVELLGLRPAPIFSRIKSLEVWNLQRGTKDLARIAELFPEVRSLEIRLSTFTGRKRAMDISPFAGRGDFDLTVRSRIDTSIRGKGKFVRDRLQIHMIS
ncbi:NACHT domain-containing protein [Streptomyces sp. NPDC048252]|uniref:NACHT domain-containing protein n=1 Tax=Streptomyces sp. NPDC048252 TaxID=3154612 RepID=UPI00341FD613